MPNDKDGASGHVVLLSAEDAVADTIVPRCQAAGADLGRLFVMEEVRGEPVAFPDHIGHFEAFLKKHDARLCVIDVLTAFLGADARSDQEISKILKPIAKVAEKLRCAVLYLRHLNKSAGTKALYRGGGSIAIIGAARAGMLVGRHPDDENVRVLAQTKKNLAKAQKSLQYRLEVTLNDVCRLDWLGECNLTADDLVQQPQTQEDKEEAEVAKTMLEEAKIWLLDVLTTQPKKAAQVKAQACAELGCSAKTVERARVAIGAKSAKIDGEWVWQL